MPARVWKIGTLQKLNLKQNHLEQLPDSISHLTALRILDVSENKLAQLPVTLCMCENLEDIDVRAHHNTRNPWQAV